MDQRKFDNQMARTLVTLILANGKIRSFNDMVRMVEIAMNSVYSKGYTDGRQEGSHRNQPKPITEPRV